MQNLCWPMISTCGSPLKTFYIEGPKHLGHVSSTLLRERLRKGEAIEDIVPACVAEAVRRAYEGKL